MADFVTVGKPLEQAWFEQMFAMETRSNEIELVGLPAVSRWLSLLNAFVGTEVIGHNAASCSLVVAYGHPLSALTTKDETLQERWTWRAGEEKR